MATGMASCDFGDWGNWGTVIIMSIYMNACLFCGEYVIGIALIQRQNDRARVAAINNVIFGPISVITFFQKDVLGSILFFGAMWHFFCDVSTGRPSFMLLAPWRTGAGRALDYLLWYESLMTLVHHLGAGVVKLALDRGFLILDPSSCVYFMLNVYIIGTGVSHLSWGLSYFEAPAKVWLTVRILGVGSRIAMASAIVSSEPISSDSGPITWRMIMIADLAWISSMLLIHFTKGVLKQCMAMKQPAFQVATKQPGRQARNSAAIVRRMTVMLPAMNDGSLDDAQRMHKELLSRQKTTRWQKAAGLALTQDSTAPSLQPALLPKPSPQNNSSLCHSVNLPLGRWSEGEVAHNPPKLNLAHV